MKGVKVITIPSEQYKTNLISVYIKRPLDRKEVTKNSLIPYVLRSGNQELVTQSLLVKALQELYGSSISVGVSKVGEKQILNFKMAYTSGKYLDEDIAEPAIRILMDTIFKPLIEDGGFKASYVQLEKEVLGEAILSKINNKGAYAMERLVQYMCDGEPFSIPEDGYMEDFEEITPQSLYEHYQHVIESSEIDVALAGNIDRDLVVDILGPYLQGRRGGLHPIPQENIRKEIQEVQEVIEKLRVTQGKLGIGYRTNIDVKDDLYIPLTIYNVILGGGVSSKLFSNVREKHSLSYSIGSGLEAIKGLLYIRAGIEVTDLEKAKRLIFAEVEDMKQGKITDVELMNAKMYLINAIRSVKDSIWSISDYMYMLSVQGREQTPEEIMDRIRSVTIEEVVVAAQKLELDTIYFLTNDEVKDGE